jgi:predicted AAA+ superfamily ATPase
MFITNGSTFKLEYNLPRRWGKTHLCGKLMEEFDSLFYITLNNEMLKHTFSLFNINSNNIYSLNQSSHFLRGRHIEYVLFDEVSDHLINEVLSYIHPKGYLALRSL